MFKRIFYHKWIISAILLALVIIFTALKSVWSGFVYFAIPFMALLCLYWIVLLILYYKEDYYDNFEEDFRRFKAETVNTYNVSTEEFENNINFYIKKLKKSLRFDKTIDVFKIIFVLTIFVIFIVILFKL